MIITFDIDGVLAIVKDHVEKYLPHDWKNYFSHTLDFPGIEPLLILLRTLKSQPCNDVWILTGRPESNRQATEEWFRLMSIPSCRFNLLMRSDNDHRPTHEIKLEWFQRLKPDLIIDDDPKVIVTAAKAGFTVLQVHGYRSTPHDMIPTNYLNEKVVTK